MKDTVLSIVSALVLGCGHPTPATSARVPEELHGDVALAFRNTTTGHIGIYLTTITTNGATPPRALTSASADERPHLLTDAGLVFTRALDVDPLGEAIMIVNLAGSGERELARCQSKCEDLTLGADGRIYYIDRQVTKLGTVMSISVRGHDAREWPPGVSWNACYVHMAPGRDGKSLLLSANNELGWPECEGKVQGIYNVPLVATARSTPLQPHHPRLAEDDLHGPIANVWQRRDTDRYFFEARVNDAPELVTFSCRADGSDVRADDTSPSWALELMSSDEAGSLGAVPPNSKHAKDLRLLGPLPGLRAFLPLARQPVANHFARFDENARVSDHP